MDKNFDNRKLPFEFMKDSNNGVILHIHHTVKTKSGDTKRIRFTNVCFSDNNENIAAIDHRGNIFIFNLTSRLFWILNEKISKCAFAKFVPRKNNNLLIGTKIGQIVEVQINSNTILRRVQAHTESIKNMAPLPILSNLFSKTILSSTATEAKIFDLDKYDEKHRLNYAQYDFHINFMDIIPKSDKIICCLNNNTIQILTNSFKKYNILQPVTMKDNLALKHSALIYDLKSLDNGDIELGNLNDRVKCLIKDSTNCLKNVAIHHNGRIMMVNCFASDNSLLLYSTLTWEIIKMIKLPIYHYLTQSQFLHHADEKRNILIFITSKQDLILLDLDDLQQKIVIHEKNCYKFNTSKNGKILSVILTTGEIFVYDLDFCFNEIKSNMLDALLKVPLLKHSAAANINDVKQMDLMMHEINKSLPKSRLISILQEYGEYPQKYRPIIWRTLLHLPQNTKVFMELLRRGYHPCVSNYEKLFPLYDHKSLRTLKKIVSSLSHWTKMLAHIDYMPTFVYPFLSIFKNDSTLSFELVATIVLNQCQLWFEFAPLEPFNYLGFIENILQEFEPSLMKYYREKCVTAKVYALTLLENAFSEILDETQWLQVWDHILTNKSTFIIFLIVAYNIMQKPHLMLLDTVQDFIYFFHDQNVIEVKNLIKQAYSIMERCPENLNPEKFMKSDVKLYLDANNYRKFENFPKKLIDIKSCEMDTMRIEEKLLEMKINELEVMEKSINDKMENELISEEHEKRLKAVDKEYQDTLSQENKRVACQRKLLNLYQCKLKESEKNMIHELKQKSMHKQVQQREEELQNLLRNLEKERQCEESRIFCAEEKTKTSSVLINARQPERRHTPHYDESLVARHEKALKQLRLQKMKLNQEIEKALMVESDSSDRVKERNTNKMIKIDSIEEMLKKIQFDYLRLKQTARDEGQYKVGVKDLEIQTNYLENQVQRLLSNIKLNVK